MLSYLNQSDIHRVIFCLDAVSIDRESTLGLKKVCHPSEPSSRELKDIQNWSVQRHPKGWDQKISTPALSGKITHMLLFES